MVPWYLHTFLAATVAFSSNALAERHAPVSTSPAPYVVAGTVMPVSDSTHQGDIDEIDEGADYNLEVVSLKPILGAARDAFDTILFTIVNAGSDTSHAAKLLVGTKSKSLATNVANTNVASRSVIPPIPPGGRVTLRVRVPKLQGDSTCYSGAIELPEEP